MSGWRRALVVLGVTTGGAILLTNALYAWPGLLPPPLRRLGNAIVDASGSTSIETSADVEWAYLFALCVFVMLVLIGVLRWAVARWLERP